jgi:hypothetical protein
MGVYCYTFDDLTVTFDHKEFIYLVVSPGNSRCAQAKSQEKLRPLLPLSESALREAMDGGGCGCNIYLTSKIES